MEIFQNKKSNSDKFIKSFSAMIKKVGQKKIDERIHLLEEAYGRR